MLQRMYPLACQSPSIETRNLVMQTLDRLTEPHPSRIQRGWERSTNWESGTRYFHIYASEVGNLRLDLQRVRWIEELRLVRMFCFIGTRPSSLVTINGRTMTQNRWVYEQVVSIIPADRVAVLDRTTPNSGIGATYGLPDLPHVYRALNTLSSTPYFVPIAACDFHGYIEEDYTPLTDTEYSPSN